MTARDVIRGELARWIQRRDEVRRKLDDIKNEQIALTSLLRTIEREVTAAQTAWDSVKEPGK